MAGQRLSFGQRVNGLGLFALLGSLLGIAPTLAQDTMIRMGYTQFTPYSFTDEDGSAAGYSIDLFERLMEPLGYDVEFIATANPAELLELIQAGAVDVTSHLAVTPERQALGVYTDPIGSFQNSLFVIADSPLETGEDLSGRRIGVVAGSFAVSAAATVPFADIIEWRDTERMIVALLAGEIDAIATPKETFQAQLRLLGLDSRIDVIEPPLLQFPRGLIVRADRSELLTGLNTSIADLSTQEIALLEERWFGRDSYFIEDVQNQWIITGLFLAVLALIGSALVAHTTKRNAHRTFAEQSRNRLLVDALNAVDLAVVIYDHDLNAVHWNDNFFAAFPKLIPNLRRGAGLHQMLVAGKTNGTSLEQTSMEDAEAFADEVIADLRSGKTVSFLTKTADRRVFERSILPVGNAMFASVSRDVTRFEEQASEIRAQGEELKRVNAKLGEFSSIVAHDLRAPLRQQSTLLDFIAEDFEDAQTHMPADAKENIKTSKAILQGLSELVEDLLKYASAGADPKETEDFDPSERMKTIRMLAAVPHGFSLQVDQHLPMVKAPKAAFDTVLRNILSNAIKHHDRKDGEIAVRGHQVGEMCVFEVEDDGPGIPEEFRDRIFQPFQRLKSRDEVPGNGLGLSMVQRTVEGWGGTVAVAASSSGGSIFRFSVRASEPTRGAAHQQLRAV